MLISLDRADWCSMDGHTEVRPSVRLGEALARSETVSMVKLANCGSSLALCLLVVALAACGSASGPTVAASTTPPFVATGPVATPTPGPLLTCKAHTGAGDEDDSVKIALTCSVSHAPASETSYTLHFGVLDPGGQYHALTPICAGPLHNNAGSCTQTYVFIFPFPINPGPVTGQFTPSGLRFGPVIPTNA